MKKVKQFAGITIVVLTIIFMTQCQSNDKTIQFRFNGNAVSSAGTHVEGIISGEVVYDKGLYNKALAINSGDGQ